MSSSQRDSVRYPLGDLLILGDLCLDVDVFTGQGDYTSKRSSRIGLGEGGSAGNVAFMADRLGLKTGLAAPLSDDTMGSLLESMVKQRHEGVSFHPIRDPKQLTCFIINLINKRGARRAYFQKNEVNCKIGNLQNIASKFRALHMSGYALELFDIKELNAFVHDLKAHGVEVTLDLFPRIGFIRESKPQIDQLLNQLDLLFGNLKEYRDLTGHSRTEEITRSFTSKGMRIVIKRGSKGAIYADPTRLISSPPLRVKPVSLKGAGDVFIAGFLASHLRGRSIYQALDAANTLAGMHVAGENDKITPRMIDLLG